MNMQDSQIYDPAQLVRDVVGVLQEHGLIIAFPDGRQAPASAAAAVLLRSLGITPGVDAEAFYSSNTDRIWGENQDVS